MKINLKKPFMTLVFSALIFPMFQIAHGAEFGDERPREHLCAITGKVMVHPVVASDDISYEREVNANIEDIEANWAEIPLEEKSIDPSLIHEEQTSINPFVVCANLFSRIFGYNNETSEILDSPFNPQRCPEELRVNILKYAATVNYFIFRNIGKLEIVCKDWKRIIDQYKVKELSKTYFDEFLYQKFLTGVLVYRPNPRSDVGKIDLPISALQNPLEGTFDLSECGDIGKYVSIHTGCRKEKKPENANKVEVWFTPGFLVEKEYENPDSFGQYQRWSARDVSMRIFWVAGKSEVSGKYSFFTLRMNELASNNPRHNLYFLYNQMTCVRNLNMPDVFTMRKTENFQLYFVDENEHLNSQ